VAYGHGGDELALPGVGDALLPATARAALGVESSFAVGRFEFRFAQRREPQWQRELGRHLPQPGFCGFGDAGASGSFDVGIADSGVSAGDIVSGGVEAAVSAEEGAVVVVPILLMIGLVLLMGGFAISTVALVWQAPALLAQLMIDAGTAGLLLVYVRPQDRHEWLTTAVRKTLPAFAMLALVFAIAGFALEWFDPEAITLFDVLANRSAN
jgi:hypothetical protein